MPVYLDYNATTPVDPRVLDAMLPWFSEQYGNAASATHSFGWAAETAVKVARETLAEGIGATPEEIIFTSGSTEALNLAIKGVAEMYASKGDHFITVATEHKAVLDSCAYLEKIGKRVTVLGVDGEGKIDLEELRGAMGEGTLLVSVMLANNETGLIHPIQKISEIVHARGAMLLTDATQAVGKIPVNVDDLGADLLAFSAHKMYGPKGCGALYKRRRRPRVALAPQMHGGGHERGFRSGTLNVPGIVGMGKAMQVALADLASDTARIGALRDQLETALLAISDTHRNGPAADRLPNVSNVSFHGVDGDALIKGLRELAVAHGSACTSAVPEPSHVLHAMGVSEQHAYASIRFSLGRFTTAEEIDFAGEYVAEQVKKLRSSS